MSEAASGPAFDDEREQLHFGPTHPIAGGAMALTVSVDGDRVLAVRPELGFHHRGFEKWSEARPWEDLPLLAERLSEDGAAIAGVACCLAIETAAGAPAPERAQWLRMLSSEIGRAKEHAARCAAVASAVDARAAAIHARNAGERLARLQEALCGARVTAGYACLGGVRHDRPRSFSVRLPGIVDELRAEVDRFERALEDDRLALARLHDRGRLDLAQCRAFGVTGPALRAAGGAFDLRRDAPYLRYERVDFDVPVGSAGDTLDRLRVCVAEWRQSLRIVVQCQRVLDHGAPGAIREEAWARGEVRVPAGAHDGIVEAANGELGFFLVSDGGASPRRFHARPPSLPLVAAIESAATGDALEDLAPTIASLHPVGVECDR